MRHHMQFWGFTICVHHPEKGTGGAQLAPPAPQNVFEIADYDDGRLPEDWERASGNRGAFFVGVRSTGELWFDFRPMNTHTHDIAIVVSVQGVNALTVQSLPHGPVLLEQYRTHCPKHGTPFMGDRFCTQCGYQMVPQNYVTNTTPDAAIQFWLDGWRGGKDGKIQQFVFSAATEGFGVAEQILGQRRARGIGFAIFRSKYPKPRVRTPQPRRSDADYLSAAEDDFAQGIDPLDILERSGNDSETLHSFGHGGSYGLKGGEMLLGGSGSRRRMLGVDRSNEETPTRRIGSPVTVEVSPGREVHQLIYLDPHDLSYWEESPAAYLVLAPADEAWVREITRKGPTAANPARLGPLAGLKMIGEE